MSDPTRGQRMPGDLRRNRLELPACPECRASEPWVLERGPAGLTLQCTACKHTWTVAMPGESW